MSTILGNVIIEEALTVNGKDVEQIANTGSLNSNTGVLGILFRNVDLQDDSKWWCSEYPAGGCSKAGKPMFQEEYMSRITPQNWLMLPHTVLDRS